MLNIADPVPVFSQIMERGLVKHELGKREIKTCRVFGISLALLDLPAAVDVIAARPADAVFAYVATPNAVHVVGVNHADRLFIEGIEGAWLRTCDSQIVRLMARWVLGARLPLAPGSDITGELFDRVITPDDPVCVIGGSVEMAERLRGRFGLRHLVQHIPPLGFIDQPEAVAAALDFVRDHPARFVFLACGAPQSEALAARIVARGGATGIGLCIGASLLFVTGLVRRAPKLWRRYGLEWLYRLRQEPRRLGWRLLTGQLPLLWVALRTLINARLAAALPGIKQERIPP